MKWAAKRDHEKIHCSPNTDAVDQMHNTMLPLCGCRLFHVKLMRQVCISYKEYYAVNNCNWIGNNYTSRMLPNSRKCREGNLILFLFVAFFRLLLPWFVHIPRLFTNTNQTIIGILIQTFFSPEYSYIINTSSSITIIDHTTPLYSYRY